MPIPAQTSGRDPRIDLLRGLSLLSIFVDHIPNNWLSHVTIHNLGFSDAAEIFVLLAGFSATHAYHNLFERRGLRVGLKRVALRCLQIYGVQVLLLLATLVLVAEWERVSSLQSTIVRPMLRDGWSGALRGVTLWALPAYLDILPLYIVLLAAFPLVRYGMARSVAGTVGASALLYAAANLFQLNLPNVVDPADAAHWYFDPFTWQFIFVLGCALALATRQRWRLMDSPPPALRAACWLYLLAAFVILDSWRFWPAPFPADFSGTSPVLGVLGNEPKTFVSPWRLLNVLAIAYLVLTSSAMTRVARWPIVRPVVACGRHSLQVFALGCILALFGRLIFRSYGVTVPAQTLVNAVGLGAMLLLGHTLDALKAGRVARQTREVPLDVQRAADESGIGSRGIADPSPRR